MVTQRVGRSRIATAKLYFYMITHNQDNPIIDSCKVTATEKVLRVAKNSSCTTNSADYAMTYNNRVHGFRSERVIAAAGFGVE